MFPRRLGRRVQEGDPLDGAFPRKSSRPIAEDRPGQSLFEKSAAGGLRGIPSRGDAKDDPGWQRGGRSERYAEIGVFRKIRRT